MKNLKYLLIFSLLFLFACKEDDTTVSGGGGGALTSLSGKLMNWTYGTGKTIKLGDYRNGKFTAISSGVIAADGSFSIALLPPPTEWMGLITEPDSGCTGTYTSTTAGAKAYGTGAVLVFDGSNLFGVAQYASRDFTPDTFYIPRLNDYVMEVVYFSAGTTINGTQTCNQDWDPDPNISTTITRIVNNLTVVAGWNKTIGKVTASTSTHFDVNVTGTEPAGMNWYFARIN